MLLTAVHSGSQNEREGVVMCIETTRGHKRIYRSLDDSHAGFDVTDDKAGSAAAPLMCFVTCL